MGNHSRAKKFSCLVPWLDGRPLINAVGTSESEVLANVGLLDLTDKQFNRIEVRDGELSVMEPVNA